MHLAERQLGGAREDCAEQAPAEQEQAAGMELALFDCMDWQDDCKTGRMMLNVPLVFSVNLLCNC